VDFAARRRGSRRGSRSRSRGIGDRRGRIRGGGPILRRQGRRRSGNESGRKERSSIRCRRSGRRTFPQTDALVPFPQVHFAQIMLAHQLEQIFHRPHIERPGRFVFVITFRHSLVLTHPLRGGLPLPEAARRSRLARLCRADTTGSATGGSTAVLRCQPAGAHGQHLDRRGGAAPDPHFGIPVRGISVVIGTLGGSGGRTRLAPPTGRRTRHHWTVHGSGEGPSG